MFKKFLILIIFFIFSASGVRAIYDPLFVPNNKFGIHIIDENDLLSAARLVNSSGGDWGYVTMVITENDRKLQKWTDAFLEMERLHLIPVIRIATGLNGNFWKKPDSSEIEKWADFLDKLPWPSQNRYVVVYNEPNHAKEWGNSLDPEGYAEILEKISLKLKKQSDDFFILQAGLDASAPNSSSTMDEEVFIKRMIAFKPDIFDKIDGWTSHSYPNPHFTGSASDRGRGTVGNYLWEIDLLKSIGIEKRLPVFITETGWPHNENNSAGSNFLSPDAVASNILQVDSEIWQDSNIAVVSPFLLNYQAYPFSNFSWKKIGSDQFYPQYEAYRSLSKTKGAPFLEKTEPVNTEIAQGDIKGISVKAESRVNFLASVFEIFKKLFI